MNISHNIQTLFVVLLITTTIFNLKANAERVIGEMMINPFFDENYDHWDFLLKLNVNIYLLRIKEAHFCQEFT